MRVHPKPANKKPSKMLQDGESRANAAVHLHESTSRWVKNTLAAKFR